MIMEANLKTVNFIGIGNMMDLGIWKWNEIAVALIYITDGRSAIRDEKILFYIIWRNGTSANSIIYIFIRVLRKIHEEKTSANIERILEETINKNGAKTTD